MEIDQLWAMTTLAATTAMATTSAFGGFASKALAGGLDRVDISPKRRQTGMLHAVSHNRHYSDAVTF